MITSKPKSNLKIAVGLFIVLDFAASVWLFAGLLRNPDSYFWLKLVFSPLLMVIGIIFGYRSYKSAITIIIGNKQVTYKYPFRTAVSFELKDIRGWKEEIVRQRQGEFRLLIIRLNNGKKLHLSSHENTNYKSVSGYFKKKSKKLV